MVIFTAVSSGVGRPPRSSRVGAALESPMMTVGQLSVGFHEVPEECVCGVAELDMDVDHTELPGWAQEFICHQAAFNA